ncbi:replicative helicase loader/inhibitor [Paenibacillus borealis]|uniref:replicative helicase loader/inhibitor n=1 Tax=Paenibacillus TaxID=44249 RepID=UPI0006934F6E|nr:replicative helicase loader/inhibitor [Paenibacillus borealis]
MEKLEVILLVRTIKANYPGFDKSPENIERLYKYLKDFPFEAAKENVDAHIKTKEFPPNVAEIRGRLGEQIEREQMKILTDQHFANLDTWSASSKPPPEGYWDEVKRKIRGEANVES